MLSLNLISLASRFSSWRIRGSGEPSPGLEWGTHDAFACTVLRSAFSGLACSFHPVCCEPAFSTSVQTLCLNKWISTPPTPTPRVLSSKYGKEHLGFILRTVGIIPVSHFSIPILGFMGSAWNSNNIQKFFLYKIVARHRNNLRSGVNSMKYVVHTPLILLISRLSWLDHWVPKMARSHLCGDVLHPMFRSALGS